MERGYKAVKLTQGTGRWSEWDKAGRLYGIVELEVGGDAQVVQPVRTLIPEGSPYGGKKRTTKAVVKRITLLDGKDAGSDYTARSDHSWEYVYAIDQEVGLTSEELSETNRYSVEKDFAAKDKECTPGIYFFSDRDAAIRLANHWANIHKPKSQ
eukprot:TRINITY_DN4851_c0_g1_i1.p1 TRINITY_DN4851_c0_g1~~TRINITY_DN4851_c0_g1_i1.p1  ORF type:complete len:154 (-),score=37.29 TRINITY_DN4851_c0_g1_i1:26-487(-)